MKCADTAPGGAACCGLEWPRLAAWLLVAGSFVYVLTALHAVVLGDSAASRLATVMSLVHEGTWYIDRPGGAEPNPFEQRTIDKVEVDGRILSTKPPVLPLAMTAEYAVLHALLGWDLRDPAYWKPVLQFMIVTLCIVPYAIGCVFFLWLLELLIADPRQRLIPLAALLFGTQLPGFATQLNNHTPAIAALIAALYFTVGIWSGRLAPSRPRLVGFGVAAALVFTLDMPLTLFVGVAGLGLIWKHPVRAAIWGGAGMLPILAVHFGAMLYVTGSPLPIQMHKAWYLFESSAWRNPGGIDALNEPWGTYLFHSTFGRYGIFLLYPALLAGPVALVCCAWRREYAAARAGYAAAALSIAVLYAYYVKSTNNYGGAAYGFRWGMGSMPLLVLMGIPVFQRIRRPWAWGLFALAMGVSAYSAWECYRAPWGDSHEWTCRLLFGPPYLKPGG
ncbi:MAG: hypothetical protein KF886_09450 [Candidatus Hydrogenedentes bacterium]|nr:hypothetical protein [Candidatus Hydrogenedentota bacterium]